MFVNAIAEKYVGCSENMLLNINHIVCVAKLCKPYEDKELQIRAVDGRIYYASIEDLLSAVDNDVQKMQLEKWSSAWRNGGTDNVCKSNIM